MAGLVLVDLDLIDEDPDNPRGEVGDVSGLKQSIVSRGQEDPIHVIPKPGGRYFLLEGHRRVKALTELGRTQAKAIERHFRTPLDQLLAQGAMHAHRKDFGPMAWCRYLRRLFDQDLTREQIARELGVSQAFVRDHLSFHHLLEWEQRSLERGEMTRKHALQILADRRAARTGKPAPAPKTNTTKAQVTAPKRIAAPPAAAEPYLNSGHRLAEQVTNRCASSGSQHAASPKIGGVGCGRCWEDTIRADALAAPRPALATAA